MKFYPPVRAVALLVLGLIPGFTVSGRSAADEPSVLVTTAPVEKREISATVTAYGMLDPDPDQVLSLSLPHAGLINRVWVRLGQRVRSGDQLLDVVTAPDARMQYLQAQSAVDYARRELERQQRLLAGQLATHAEVDAAARTLNDAQAGLNALQAARHGRCRGNAARPARRHRHAAGCVPG